MRRLLAVHGALLWLAVCLGATQPATWAANPITVEPATSMPTKVPDLVSFAKLAPTVPDILLAVEGVKVNIRHAATATEIGIFSNCPAHWNVRGNVIRQVALSTAQKGVSLRADAFGGQVAVNGRIYQLPKGSDGAIRNLKISDGVVMANGQKLEPLVGSDVAGSCTGPDTLEIVVPSSYVGGLELYCQGASEIALDTWQGGSIIANLNGASKLQAGKLQKLSKTVIDVQGTGQAQIKELLTKAFVANINGAGSVSVESGRADMSNATISGTGTMTFHGRFDNLKKSVNGTGTITIVD